MTEIPEKIKESLKRLEESMRERANMKRGVPGPQGPNGEENVRITIGPCGSHTHNHALKEEDFISKDIMTQILWKHQDS